MSVPGDGNGKTRTNHPFFATPSSYQSLPKRVVLDFSYAKIARVREPPCA